MFLKTIESELNLMIKELTIFVSGVFSKLTGTGVAMASIIAIFAPVTPIVYTMMVLVFLDFVTGTLKSFHESGRRVCFCRETFAHITSAGLGRTIMKMLAYYILIVAAFIIGTFVIPIESGVMITKVVTSTIAIRELISIVENLTPWIGDNFIVTLRNILKGGVKAGLDNKND